MRNTSTAVLTMYMKIEQMKPEEVRLYPECTQQVHVAIWI